MCVHKHTCVYIHVLVGWEELTTPKVLWKAVRGWHTPVSGAQDWHRVTGTAVPTGCPALLGVDTHTHTHTHTHRA